MLFLFIFIEHIGDVNLLNKTMKDNNENLIKSFDCAMKKVNETTDLVSFVDLSKAEYILEYPKFSKCYVGKIEALKGL